MQPKACTYTIDLLIYDKLFHSLRVGYKAYSHEDIQVVVSVFCSVNTECAHRDPDKISPYDKNVSFKTQVRHLSYPLTSNNYK